MLTNFKDHLHRGRNLKVSIYTLYARKNKNTGNPINSEYINTYKSEQYNGIPFLSTIENNGNHYISFEYSKVVQQGQMPIQEEVLISYPHLMDFNQWLRSMYNSITKEFNNIFDGNQVTQQYSNHSWASPYFISNKQIGIAPATIQNSKNPNSIEIGFNIMVNGADKYDFISANTFISLLALLIDISNTPLEFRKQCTQAEMHGKIIENNQLIKGILRSSGNPTDMSNHNLDEKQEFRNNSGGNNRNFNNNNGNNFNNNFNNFNQQPQQSNNRFGNFNNQQQQSQQSNFNNNFGNNNQPSQPQNNPFNNQQQSNQFNNSNQQQNNQFNNQQQQPQNNPFANAPDINDDDLPFDTPDNNSSDNNNNDNRQIDKNNVFKNDAEPKKENGNMNDLSNSVNNDINSDDGNNKGKANELLNKFMENGKDAEDDLDL